MTFQQFREVLDTVFMAAVVLVIFCTGLAALVRFMCKDENVTYICTTVVQVFTSRRKDTKGESET